MLDDGNLDCKWLDIRALAESFLKPDQRLEDVIFFTSYIANDPKKEKRQRTYIDALVSKKVKIIKGKYERKEVECENCSNIWYRTNEKMTDVNIAISMIMDAVNSRYDVAILISGDSDLVPAIIAIKENFPTKKIIVVFPPARQNLSVKQAAHASIQLGRNILLRHQLEEEVMSANGFILRKPNQWC
jgi:uncharacterized LabA/DUF88 family protein